MYVAPELKDTPIRAFEAKGARHVLAERYAVKSTVLLSTHLP